MSGIRSIHRNATVKGVAVAASAPIYVDSDDNRLKMIPAGSGTTEVVLQEAGGASAQSVLITTKQLTVAESGMTFFLALAAGFVVTLPAPAVGLKYEFFVQIAPTGDYTIVTSGASQILAGLVHSSDGVDGDSETAFTATTITFVAAGSASTIGDGCTLWSDGTSWYARCFCNISTGMTITG